MTPSQRLRLFCLFAALSLALVVFTVPSGAQQTLPYDTQAVFRTHVPHLSSGHGGGGGNGGKPGSGGGTVPFTGPGYTSVGAPVTPTTTGPEAEEAIAADPLVSGTLVAAISDFSLRGGSNTTKYAVSTDNGITWSESFVPLDAGGQLATADGKTWPYNSDPVPAIDRAGNVYLANLYFHSETGDNSNGMYVSVGQDWLPGLGITAATTLPVSVQSNPGTTIVEDKEWIAVDNSQLSPFVGQVYVSWTRFIGSTSDMILFSRSSDQAATWSAPIQISAPAQNGAVQGSSIAVGPAGDIYVAYEVFYVGGKRQQFLAKSVDGGTTFSSPVAVTPLFNELSFNSTYRKNSFPAIAVSPNGNVYITYADQAGRNAKVKFIRSSGAEFSSPLALNDSTTGQRLMPSIAIDAFGQIHVSWFDTRLAGQNSTTKYDIFATRSVDDGNTFSPNARVTIATVDAGSASFIGDYGGTAADLGSAHPVWTNGGFNNGRLQTAALSY